jgi:hypothetical protein
VISCSMCSRSRTQSTVMELILHSKNIQCCDINWIQKMMQISVLLFGLFGSEFMNKPQTMNQRWYFLMNCSHIVNHWQQVGLLLKLFEWGIVWLHNMAVLCMPTRNLLSSHVTKPKNNSSM